MATDRHQIKRGDTPTLRWSLGRDITGATAKLIVADRAGVAVISAAATIVNAVTGEVSFTLTASQLAVGDYTVEVETTKAGVILTHPSIGTSSIKVSADLG